MTKCNHTQCSICLRRECHTGIGKCREFGELMVCPYCVAKAVSWAHKSAMQWGGDYGEQPCKFSKESAPTQDEVPVYDVLTGETKPRKDWHNHLGGTNVSGCPACEAK